MSKGFRIDSPNTEISGVWKYPLALNNPVCHRPTHLANFLPLFCQHCYDCTLWQIYSVDISRAKFKFFLIDLHHWVHISRLCPLFLLLSSFLSPLAKIDRARKTAITAEIIWPFHLFLLLSPSPLHLSHPLRLHCHGLKGATTILQCSCSGWPTGNVYLPSIPADGQFLFFLSKSKTPRSRDAVFCWPKRGGTFQYSAYRILWLPRDTAKI